MQEHIIVLSLIGGGGTVSCRPECECDYTRATEEPT